MNNLISIIMPAYNAEKYIIEAIESVIKQTYQNWELLIVNDGSKDNTEEVILSFEDSRIQYYIKENGGVSSARNLALNQMKGEYFCFLDADDYFTPNSLQSRLNVFQSDEKVAFVDGEIDVFDNQTKKILRTFKPTFQGVPTKDLLQLSGRCFFSITWLIKRRVDINYHFREDMSHAEDLLFFIVNSDKQIYDSTSDKIMCYRKGNVSAMSNVNALEVGYWQLYAQVKKLSFVRKIDLFFMASKIKQFMFLEYVNSKDYILAIKSLFK
jgi:teichuronic acid biosynthesis glycosyltransferase TuaG